MPNTWQAAEPLDPTAWIPLSALAIEGLGTGQSIEDRIKYLEKRLADEVIHDDIGRPCVARSVARDLFTQRAERKAAAAQRSRQNAARIGAETAKTRARVNAIKERQERERLQLDDVDMPTQAIAQITTADHDARTNRTSQHLAEMLSGEQVYHSLTGQRGQD